MLSPSTAFCRDTTRPRLFRREWLWLALLALPLASIAGGNPEHLAEQGESADLRVHQQASQQTRQQPEPEPEPEPEKSPMETARPDTALKTAEDQKTASQQVSKQASEPGPKPLSEHRNIVLAPYTLTYKTTLKGIEIRSQRHLERTGKNTYKAHGKASLMFLGIEEYAQFSVVKGTQVVAQEYFYDRQGMSSSKDFHILFDWKNGRAVNQLRKDPWQIPIKQGMLDMLSHQEQLRLDAMAAGGLQTGTEFSYAIVKKEKISRYIYRITGSELIDTEAGTIDTIRIEKIEDDDERQTIVWLAKDWGYVIARLDHEEKGSTNRMELVGGSIDGRTVSGATVSGGN